MRILYAITRSELGGSQTHLLDLLKAACLKHEVGFITGENGPLVEKAKDLGIKTWLVPSLVREVAPIRDLVAMRDVARIIADFHPDIVHGHSTKAGCVARIAAKMRGCPSVFTAHGWAFTDGVPAARRAMALCMERVLASFSSRIICVSKYDHDLALSNKVGNVRKLRTIRNGLPDTDLQPSNCNHNPVRVAMVARFAPPKDFALLIRAASLLDRHYELMLVGEGELIGDCQKQARDLGVEGRVRFLGSRTDVPDILAESDIFVLATNFEGFPYSILEAMRAGLPVIASDVGGVSEAVMDGSTGYLVPRGDAKALSNKLKALLDDPDLRCKMGQAGRGYFLENFTASKMVEETFMVYNSIRRDAR